ncbi:MAG: Wzz/FepE/Etk N-terminal domain-containing protein [Candidatus Acidiferrum sp.]|jgi:capsule polysaccharide export protein KpsE/RkpR
MKYSSGAPMRQPVPELPESEAPEAELPEALRETPEENKNTLRHLRLLWARRGMLYRVSLYAMLASAAIAFMIPKRYESIARLMPPDNQSGSGLAMAAAAMSGGTASGGLGAIANDVLGLKSTSDIFVGILASRTVQDEVIRKFDLLKLYGTKSMDDAEKGLAAQTGISVDRKSQIITIMVTDKSPQRAAAIGQAYVEQLNRLVSELSTSSARRERVFLEGRLQAVSKDLEDAEKDFSQFASKNTAIDVKEQAKAMVEAAATLQGQLIAAQSQYEGLRQIYTDNNPRVRTIKARIDELQRQLEKLGGKGESSTDVSSAAGDSLYPSIRKLPLLGVTYADLYRRTRIQEAVLEVLTREYEMAKVEEVKEIPTVRVLDPANIPDRKSYPPRLLIIFMGTAFAFAAATIWLFGKTAWEQTDHHDARKIFAQEVFADLQARLPQFAQNGAKTRRGAGSFLGLRRGSSDRDNAEE